MSRWVYWVSLLAIAAVVGFAGIKLHGDPQAKFGDLFKLGIDLEGGTSLIYDLRSADPNLPPPAAADAKKVIMSRIDPTGTRGYVVRAVGAHRLEIVLPGRATRVDAKAEAVTADLLVVAQKAAAEQKNPEVAAILQSNAAAFQAGTLLRVGMSPPLYLQDIQDRVMKAVAERMPAQAGKVAVVGLGAGGDPGQWKEVGVYTTIPMTDAKVVDAWQKLVSGALSAQRDVTEVKRLVRQAGFLEFRIVADKVKDREKANFERLVTLKRAGQAPDSTQWRWYPLKKGWEWYKQGLLDQWNFVYVVDEKSQVVQILVNVGDGQDVSGRDLANAHATQQDAEPVVAFQMKAEASARFGRLTSAEMRLRHLAIILDGVVQSAPVLQATLTTNGVITGYKDRRELEEVVKVLNSGQLAASLGDPVTERTVGPELGEDNIRNGLRASLIGVLVVMVFMAIYYLFAGLVADVALVLNLILTICIMYVVGQAWTLPGIAGLILALAMAVDANVLIFERLREEKGKEGSLSFALKKAYARAFTTIFDSNLTTVIPAFVLLMPGLATEEVKGFAVVMIIGIGVSMFTAVVITRMIFETGIRWGLIKQVKMLHFFEKPNLDWMKFARFAFVSTAAVALVGVILFSARGDEKYDIEFVGGTQVELATDQAALLQATAQEFPNTPKDQLPSKFIELVRARVAKSVSPAATVQELEYSGETGEVALSRFLISVPASGGIVSGEKAIKDAIATSFAAMQPKGAEQTVTATTSELSEDVIRRNMEPAKPEAVPAAAATGTAGAVPAEVSVRFIPDELRQYMGKIRVEATIDPPASLTEIQRRIDMLLRERYPDLVGTPIRVVAGQSAGTAGELKSFELWVRDDYAGKKADTPNPQFWAGIVQALGRQEAFASTTSFEPTMAGEAWQKAVIAILVSLALMAVYIWFRFAKFTSGIAAVVATIHDVLVTLGAVTAASLIAGLWTGNFLFLTDMKVNLPLIGAFLTLVGYSVNDTIVVFDRIRENRGKYGDLSPTIINNSVNQTLSRTVLTSSTVFLAVVALYFFGGKTSSIHGLAFVMLVGTIVGCYSSVAIASPILVMNEYLKRLFAWTYPILAGAVLVYFACIWMKPSEFISQWLALGATVVSLAWIAVVTWGSVSLAYGRPWTLYQTAPGLVRLVAGLSMLAPVVTVALFAAAVIAPKVSGVPAWAAPGAFAALATCPATYLFYRLVWGKEAQRNQARAK
jgi:SecD/SecF fusion protein